MKLTHPCKDTCSGYSQDCADQVAALKERNRELEFALKDILETVSLEWFVQQFGRDTTASGQSTGIVARIHNQDMQDRIKATLERARCTLAERAANTE
jgi:hypothetical protein